MRKITKQQRQQMRRYLDQGYDCATIDRDGNICPGYRHDRVGMVLDHLDMVTHVLELLAERDAR